MYNWTTDGIRFLQRCNTRVIRLWELQGNWFCVPVQKKVQAKVQATETWLQMRRRGGKPTGNLQDYEGEEGEHRKVTVWFVLSFLKDTYQYTFFILKDCTFKPGKVDMLCVQSSWCVPYGSGEERREEKEKTKECVNMESIWMMSSVDNHGRAD